MPQTWSGKLEDDVKSDAIVIQFSKEFISPFIELNESVLIKNMLQHSERGISFEIDEALVSEITDLTEAKGVNRVLKLISIFGHAPKS